MADRWIYILTNRPNGTLYSRHVGGTDNLARRVCEHREGKSNYPPAWKVRLILVSNPN